MGLNKILNSPYSHLQIKVTQKTPCNLPYYGTIIRGWLGDAFWKNREVWQRIFKNPNIDVRPYFHYTVTCGEIHLVNLTFMGYATSYLRKILDALSAKHISHIGGIPAKIDLLRYEEKKVALLPPAKDIEIKFISPTSLVENGKITYGPPPFNLLLMSLARSVNRFCKYYFKPAYPVHLTTLDHLKAKIEKFEVYPFLWGHKSMRERVMTMRGITGSVKYRLERKPSQEIMKILSLTEVFQIGKWISYGFGKVEVNT